MSKACRKGIRLPACLQLCAPSPVQLSGTSRDSGRQGIVLSLCFSAAVWT